MPKIDANLPRPISTGQTNSSPALKPATTGAPAAPAQPQGWTKAATQPKAATVPAQINSPDANKAIVCPVLGALVAEGKVPVQPDGSIKMEDLTKALGDLGQSKPFLVGTHPIGWAANTLSDLPANVMGNQFNVMELRSGNIKHPGDSAVLTAGKFDQGKFDALVSHAKNGRMSEDDFAEAIASNVLRDAKVGQLADDFGRGKNFSQVEFGALLSTFGTKDPQTGKVSIPVEDLRAMYQDKRIPPGRSGNATLLNAGAISASLGVKVDAQLASRAMGGLLTATGLASKGADLADGKPGKTAGSQAANGAGKAANCPYLSGAAKPPAKPADTVNAHTQAGMSSDQ